MGHLTRNLRMLDFSDDEPTWPRIRIIQTGLAREEPGPEQSETPTTDTHKDGCNCPACLWDPRD